VIKVEREEPLVLIRPKPLRLISSHRSRSGIDVPALLAAETAQTQQRLFIYFRTAAFVENIAASSFRAEVEKGGRGYDK
jgi:hypothetical protein